MAVSASCDDRSLPYFYSGRRLHLYLGNDCVKECPYRFCLLPASPWFLHCRWTFYIALATLSINPIFSDCHRCACLTSVSVSDDDYCINTPLFELYCTLLISVHFQLHVFPRHPIKHSNCRTACTERLSRNTADLKRNPDNLNTGRFIRPRQRDCVLTYVIIHWGTLSSWQNEYDLFHMMSLVARQSNNFLIR